VIDAFTPDRADYLAPIATDVRFIIIY